MKSESEIKGLMNKLIEAIKSKNPGALKLIYAQNVVSFDVQPPLHALGGEAKLKNWDDAFALFQLPINYEIRKLKITSGNDIAFCHCFARLDGKLNNGKTILGFWVRATLCFQKINGNWLIVHDHVSAPLDFESGRALLDLEP